MASIGLVLGASTAAEAATTINYSNAQVSYDNNPGNGAESWIWAWNNNSYTIRIDYQYYDNGIDSMWVNPYSATSVNANRDIWRVRYCWWDDRSQYWGCGGWS
ncbi:hypothetical protein ACFV3F_28725 [Streptomyces sp. NPDC059717]|uniref:hypothetical protein n=1 Tax=Streptomyces sp. NPDC059717 TaxID=3346922 RepID=UPI00368AAE26